MDLVTLTFKGPRTVEAAGPSTVDEILDAAGYQSLDLVLTALSVSGTLWIRVETSLTLDAPVWESLGVFTPLVAPKTIDRRSFQKLLRFVRWRVEYLTGSSATFTIAGTAQ